MKIERPQGFSNTLDVSLHEFGLHGDKAYFQDSLSLKLPLQTYVYVLTMNIGGMAVWPKLSPNEEACGVTAIPFYWMMIITEIELP